MNPETIPIRKRIFTLVSNKGNFLLTSVVTPSTLCPTTISAVRLHVTWWPRFAGDSYDI